MNVVTLPPISHWYVTLTLSGDAWCEPALCDALDRLVDERPLLQSCRYGLDAVELRYWEQAADVQDAAAMALRLWGEHKQSAALPDWHVVGLEVVHRDTIHRRRLEGLHAQPVALALAEVRPF